MTAEQRKARGRNTGPGAPALPFRPQCLEEAPGFRGWGALLGGVAPIWEPGPPALPGLCVPPPGLRTGPDSTLTGHGAPAPVRLISDGSPATLSHRGPQRERGCHMARLARLLSALAVVFLVAGASTKY